MHLPARELTLGFITRARNGEEAVMLHTNVPANFTANGLVQNEYVTQGENASRDGMIARTGAHDGSFDGRA